MKQYDTHNLFGTGMAMNHHAAFKAVLNKRPFLLSRCRVDNQLSRCVGLCLCCRLAYLLAALVHHQQPEQQQYTVLGRARTDNDCPT